jgi:acyl dehydratase
MSTAADRSPLYLDDFAVGQVFRTSTLPVDTDSIKAFARQFDPQPFHLDEAAAAKTLFGGLAASGWHTAAMTMLLLVKEGIPVAGGIIGAGMEEMRWPRPVRPGDLLHLETEVLELRPSQSNPKRGILKMRTTTFNQNNEPVQVMTGSLVVPRRPQA